VHVLLAAGSHRVATDHVLGRVCPLGVTVCLCVVISSMQGFYKTI